jgi:hypothetical protein
MPSPSHGVRIADIGRTNDQNRSNVPARNIIPNRLELRHIPGKLPALNAAIAAIYDQDFEILGTNATTALQDPNPEGGWLSRTAGADNDQSIILPHLDSEQTPWTMNTWGTDKEVEWAAYILTPATVTLVTYWAGLKLTNTSVVATDNDQVFFRVTASGNWTLYYSIGGTDYSVDTGVALAASTRYHFEVKIDSGRKASCYINGAFVFQTPALTDATDLIPYVGVHANTAAERNIGYLGQTISRVIG